MPAVHSVWQTNHVKRYKLAKPPSFDLEELLRQLRNEHGGPP
ncbi:MAG TPA: hypothetical protein VF120_18475 [Ktedonobacterales bacterium]